MQGVAIKAGDLPLASVSVKSSANTPAVFAVSSPTDAKKPTVEAERLDNSVMDSPKKNNPA